MRFGIVFLLLVVQAAASPSCGGNPVVDPKVTFSIGGSAAGRHQLSAFTTSKTCEQFYGFDASVHSSLFPERPNIVDNRMFTIGAVQASDGFCLFTVAGSRDASQSGSNGVLKGKVEGMTAGMLLVADDNHEAVFTNNMLVGEWNWVQQKTDGLLFKLGDGCHDLNFTFAQDYQNIHGLQVVGLDGSGNVKKVPFLAFPDWSFPLRISFCDKCTPAPSVASYFVSGAGGCDASPASTITIGAQQFTVKAFDVRTQHTCKGFYAYKDDHDFSANPHLAQYDFLELRRLSVVLVHAYDGLCLATIANKGGNQPNSLGGTLKITAAGLTATAIQGDDPEEVTADANGVITGDWKWEPCCTDGMIVGPLDTGCATSTFTVVRSTNLDGINVVGADDSPSGFSVHRVSPMTQNMQIDAHLCDSCDPGRVDDGPGGNGDAGDCPIGACSPVACETVGKITRRATSSTGHVQMCWGGTCTITSTADQIVNEADVEE